MALGLSTVVIFCLLSALPHWLYGAGEDSLLLTTEYGSTYNYNMTKEVFLMEQKKILCSKKNETLHQCEDEEGNFAPQIILFVAQFISGMGAPLFHTLGVSYMDDNIKKSKTPALVSEYEVKIKFRGNLYFMFSGFSYFLRMLGPPIGYALASFSLNMFISPTLTPTITKNDPRWLGAWWLGWLVLGSLLFVFGSLLAFFPKTLPRAAARKEEKQSHVSTIEQNDSTTTKKEELPSSLKGI